MRSLAAGTRVLRREPLALVPLGAEALVAGLLAAWGVLPTDGGAVASVAVFPFDAYFDLKHLLAHAPSWPAFAATLLAGCLVRGSVLGTTLWIADGRPGPVAAVWARAARGYAAAYVVLYLPAALMFTGVAIRYAPFVWTAGALGLAAGVALARRAVSLDAGAGAADRSVVPRLANVVTYGVVLAVAAAAMAALEPVHPLLSALLLATSGPVHALVLLGCREHARTGTQPEGGLVAKAVAVGLLALAVMTLYDRYVRSPEPVAQVDPPGNLLLLGGADSTSTTGALTGIDPRILGFTRGRTELLSYRGAGRTYEAADTRGDLDEVATRISQQIAETDKPVYLYGHSQAALILDRIATRGLPLPDRSVVVAPPPPVPPPVAAPPPGGSGPGSVGAGSARALAWVFDRLGVPTYDIDAPASPANLDAVVVSDRRISRLAVWALADSVWLEGDWRRPGELNIVVPTDHVGAVNDARTIAAARRFLAGGSVRDDRLSGWGFAAHALRYLFEPWRP